MEAGCVIHGQGKETFMRSNIVSIKDIVSRSQVHAQSSKQVNERRCSCLTRWSISELRPSSQDDVYSLAWLWCFTHYPHVPKTASDVFKQWRVSSPHLIHLDHQVCYFVARKTRQLHYNNKDLLKTVRVDMMINLNTKHLIPQNRRFQDHVDLIFEAESSFIISFSFSCRYV